MKESTFQFLGYRISKIECVIKDSFNTTENKFAQSIQVQLNYNEHNSRFVEVVLQIDVKSADETFYFFITIKGGFQAEEEMPPELFDVMAKQNAPAILFPFARAIITSYTAQANIPPIILPTVNFAAPPQEKKES